MAGANGVDGGRPVGQAFQDPAEAIRAEADHGDAGGEEAASIIPHKLQRVMNANLSAGVYPREWKRARLVLVKKPEKQNGTPVPCRPVCTPNDVSKVYESILERRLTEFLEQQGNRQYGLRRGRTAVDATQEYLGLLLDSSCRFDEHLECQATKMSPAAGALVESCATRWDHRTGADSCTRQDSCSFCAEATTKNRNIEKETITMWTNRGYRTAAIAKT
ncbi:UNVERIFIED_CONTAM: hypothetical protein PYX00_008836 [Menopon gallinae]|uniref:Reverse transcriptase n=1 Tax=Menopon gallinae TaxID=328185 RepID=A0AAW2H8U3_9NEOP